MKKYRVLLFSDCPTFGGSEYVVVNILRSQFLRNYFEFHFVYRKHKEYTAYVDKLLSNEHEIILYPLKLWSNDSLFYKINQLFHNQYVRYCIKAPFWMISYLGLYGWHNKKVITNFLRVAPTPDVIHINNGGYPGAETCRHFSISAGKLNIRSLFQVNNCAGPARKTKMDLEVENNTIFFLTASKYAKSVLARNKGFCLEHIKTLYNAVDEPIILTSKDDIYKDLGIDSNDIVITEVALMEKRKGHIPLLKAILVLKENNSELYKKIKLLIIGKGEEEKNIRRLVSENNMEDHVYLLGYRNNYIDYINASDIFVLPSLYNEDMPLSILSAMALSKPIVSTKVAGIPEEVKDGENGYLADPVSLNFVNELARCLIFAYQKREQLGEQSRIRYDNLFSRSLYENKLKDLYEYCAQHN